VRKPIRTTVIAPTVAGVLAVCAIAVAAQWHLPKGQPQGSPHHVLRVHGKIDQLIPGKARTLRMRVRNPTDRAITIYRARTTVRRSHGPGHSCPAWLLIVRTWKGHRRIPPHTRTFLRVGVQLRAHAGNRCQGAHWEFRYHVRGVGGV
jgi:hypothetical protein